MARAEGNGNDFSAFSAMVQCRPTCACWPQGEFTQNEVAILGSMHALGSRDLWDRDDHSRLQQLLRLLSIAEAIMTPRRLAHILSVPVHVNRWMCGATIPFTFAMVVFSQNLEQNLSVGPIVDILARVPLCPQIGTSNNHGWFPQMSVRHPGRAVRAAWRHYSLVHIMHYARPVFNRLLSTPCMYPVCGCGPCSTIPGLDVMDAAAVVQWRRWWPRRGRRQWLCHVAACARGRKPIVPMCSIA